MSDTPRPRKSCEVIDVPVENGQAGSVAPELVFDVAE